MSLLQLSLRTMLWILFAAAVVTGWGWERWRLQAEIESRPADYRISWGDRSKWVRNRIAMVERLSSLSDHEFREVLKKPASPEDHGLEFDIRQFEMARRGMAKEFRDHLRNLANDPEGPNGKLLTLLRRAEGKPDPAQIEVKFVDRDEDGNAFNPVHVRGIIRNNDVDRQLLCVSLPCDELWRMEMRDEWGGEVPVSNHWAFPTSGWGPPTTKLVFGQAGEERDLLDPRLYISPPPSGRYQLQLVYSPANGIAHHPDFSGLVVWRSAPIWVDVLNREPQLFDDSIIRLGVVIAFALVALSVAYYFASRRPEDDVRLIPWTDIACCGLMIALAIGWWFDGRQLRKYLARLRPEQNADWTIVVPQEKSGESGAPKDKTKK